MVRFDQGKYNVKMCMSSIENTVVPSIHITKAYITPPALQHLEGILCPSPTLHEGFHLASLPCYGINRVLLSDQLFISGCIRPVCPKECRLTREMEMAPTPAGPAR